MCLGSKVDITHYCNIMTLYQIRIYVNTGVYYKNSFISNILLLYTFAIEC